MRLATIRNDASEPTLTINDFTMRTYTIRTTDSLIVGHYERFQGRILEVHQCDEEMDEDIATRLITELVDKYSSPDVDIHMMSDSDSLTNIGLVEVEVVHVYNWVLRNGNLSNPGCKRIIIYKKHQRDGYVKAILDLATQLEFGRSDICGSD